MNTMNNNIKIGLVIMASGLGKRFGGNKLMAILGDKPMVKWIIDTSEGVFDERIVVTRNEQVADLCGSLGIYCIYHELPNRSDTVRLGLTALLDKVDYCYFAPADQPLLTRSTLIKLLNAARENSSRIVRTNFNDTVGAPIGFPKNYFEELLNLPEGKGGSWVANKYSETVVRVPVENELELVDIDTKEDMERMQSYYSRNN